MPCDSDRSIIGRKQKLTGCSRWKKEKAVKKVVEELKEGPAYPQHFIVNVGMPEKTVHRTLDTLKSEGKVRQNAKRGKYLLPGYETGSPDIGKQTQVYQKHLSEYLSWGWKFKTQLGQERAIVEFHPSELPFQRVKDLKGEGIHGPQKLLFRNVAENPDVMTRSQLNKYEEHLKYPKLYDESEILVTLYTFAPLADERVPNDVRKQILQTILNTDDSLEGNIGLKIERQMPSPKGYMDWLRKHEVQQHPIRGVREDAKGKEVLEGPTHVDAQITTNNLLILIEVKFTADLQYGTTYSSHRNQLARTIDVGIEAAERLGKKLTVLLCTPKVYMEKKSRLYYYKIQEYTNPANIKNDIQWRPVKAFKGVVVRWVSLEEVIKIAYSHVEEYLSPEEMQELRDFFDSRMLR